MTDNDLARIGFGQSIAVTPIQLCTAVCAAVNGGELYRPYVVDRMIDGEGNAVFTADTSPVRRVISEETSRKVREILHSYGLNMTIDGSAANEENSVAEANNMTGRTVTVGKAITVTFRASAVGSQ